MDKYTVVNSSGEIDISASTAKYSTALSTWVNENKIDTDTISEAVNSILSKYPGERVKMPALLSEVTMAVSSNPENYSRDKKRIHSFITGQSKAGKLFVVKGSKGGVGLTAPTKKTA